MAFWTNTAFSQTNNKGVCRYLIVYRLVAWACVPAEYFKSNQAISVKLDVVIWPTNWKNRLPFGRDPVPDTDTESLSTSLTIAE